MHYLITGGAGFIGGHLTESLLKDGHKVTVIDNLSTGSLENLKAVANSPDLRFIEADIVNMDGLEILAMEADAIFHLAAAVGVELVVHDPVRTIITNVHGTENVLKAAAKQDTRVIIASTSEVYGKSTKARFSETDDLLIGCPTHSRWSYACSKLLDEFYLMAYYRDMKIKGTVLRFFNTVGPRQTGQYGMVIPRFVAKALAGQDVTVYGDGTQTRCFCHVFDTIRALHAITACEESYGGIYNIGGNHSVTISELAELIIARLGSSSKITYIPYEEAYEKGFEDMLHRAPDTTVVKNLLDWEATLTLEQIIDDVAACLRNK